ncbi:MoaD/ThiS family protein [Clostridium grantii]|uniref:ThiS family protein n=1 Tax=Clostridium grantii DSM 8605 TaxID=1121316 RepID=A0A1M5TNL7_9CLOT|nr:MoaD/ThiS family protein [Clostridium grantii]SHH52279.1 ThiS family protein [Clostridium grantii DSM 8605]
MVKIIFLGPLGRFMPEEDENGYWNVEATGKTVEEIINSTKVSESKMNYSVLVNDERKSRDYVLNDGDDVSILPLFCAG